MSLMFKAFIFFVYMVLVFAFGSLIITAFIVGIDKLNDYVDTHKTDDTDDENISW